MDAHYQFQNAM